jgi:hypothetical protein
MIRRILGVIILLVSLIMVAVLLGGAFFAGQAVDTVGDGLDSVLALTVDTLDTVSATLEQTQATITEANNALDTATEATVNLAKTVSDTQPLMESMSKVVAEDVPDNIEAIQATIPNITQVAGVIDSALTKLSDFGISRTIPIPFNPITLEFDLGIDYNPDEPFDETISALGDSLEGMPEELRSLQGDLETLSADLELLTGNIETASGDLETINEQVALFIPILDDYLRIVGEINDSMLQARGQLQAQLETVKTVLTALFIVLSLTQLAPLYLGWELVTGQRPGQDQGKEAAVESPPSPPEKVVEEPPQLQPNVMVEEKVESPPETVVEKPAEDSQETIVEESPPLGEEETSEGQT